MEQIYTIPVHEAFEASEADPSCGCPLCALHRQLEEKELDTILGAAMMEPDIRIKTNEEGFCRLHYDMMMTRKNRLGMALTLESHLKELQDDLKGKSLGGAGAKQIKRLDALDNSCYICRRIGFYFDHMMETTVLLWHTEPEFPKCFSAQPYFCLPHYRMLLEYGQRKLPKKIFPEFAASCAEVVNRYLSTLTEDVSWFCKKFDYRYDEEPWYNSKDAVERAVKFLRADLHAADSKTK